MQPLFSQSPLLAGQVSRTFELPGLNVDGSGGRVFVIDVFRDAGSASSTTPGGADINDVALCLIEQLSADGSTWTALHTTDTSGRGFFMPDPSAGVLRVTNQGPGAVSSILIADEVAR